jgi:hypothetical protein
VRQPSWPEGRHVDKVTRDFITAKVLEKATKMAANPEEGYAAGYSPHREYSQSEELGSGGSVQVNSEKEAWLKGIMERDLPNTHYRIRPTVGDEISLVIED